MFWDVLGESWGRLERILVRLGGVLGASWAALGASWGRRGASWELLGSSCGRLVGVLGRLGSSCTRFSCKKVARFRHASLDCNFHLISVRFCF